MRSGPGQAEGHLGLVRHIVRRFAHSGHDPDELVQVGVLGLLKALRGFDPARGTAFSSYAVPFILGEIQRHLRAAVPLTMDREGGRLAREARSAEAELAQRLGREPTVPELAGALGVAVADLAAVLNGARAPDELPAAANIPAADVWEGVAERLDLRAMLGRLPAGERRVVVLRYLAGRTQVEVGRALGISQPQVSRLERRAIDRLRRLAAEPAAATGPFEP